MKKRLFSWVMTLVMLIGLLSSGAAAVEIRAASLEVSQTAENLDDDYISEVTMTIPSDAYRRSVDIVFVLDGSTSSDASTLAEDAAKMLEELAGIQNLDVNAGLVIFGGSIPILYESDSLADVADTEKLNELTEKMTDKSYDGVTGRSGSNLQAGIEAARSLLKSGSAAAADKYMVLLTDGGARMWINNEGEAVAQMPYQNNWNTNEDFLARYIEGNLKLRTFDEIIEDAAAGKEIGKYAINEEQSKDADNIVKNIDLTMDVNTSLDYYTNLESATYFAAQSVIELKQEGEANVVWVDYPYNKGSKYGDYTESFKAWLAEEGYITRYDSDQINDPFAQVKDSLIYYVDAGSSVENVIGYGTDNYGNAYDFEMVNLDDLKLTVGTEILQTVKIGENRYGFGTPDSTGTYPFELTYDPDGKNNDGKDSFELKINTTVKLDETVELVYQVHLTDPQTISGTYGTYDEDGSESLDALLVSKEAILYPVDSDGTQGAEVPFPLPTVSYTVTPAAAEKVTINIAPMTVYVGGNGYESVVTDHQGNVAGVNENTLPEPGYTLDLPENVDTWLKESLGVSADTTLDISQYLTFTYDDGAETRVWTIERYDQNEGNSSQINGRYLYRLVSAENQPAIRLEFEDAEGNLMTSDNFTIDQNHPNQTYTMSIYPGALDQGLVKAEIRLPGAASGHSYDIELVSAELKIRGVVSDEENPTTEIITGKEQEGAVSNITAQVPQGTKYYYKTSENQISAIQVADASAVRLLVDEVLSSATSALEQAAVEEFDALPDDYNIEMKYLDLVYTKNSNAVVGATNPITVYWPYPEGTDQDTEFFIVHYKGLDRNDDEALTDDYTMEFYSADRQDDKYMLECTEQGIRFTVDSFSPFALIWGKTSDGKSDSILPGSSESVSASGAPLTGDSDTVSIWMLTGLCMLAVVLQIRKTRRG